MLFYTLLVQYFAKQELICDSIMAELELLGICLTQISSITD